MPRNLVPAEDSGRRGGQARVAKGLAKLPQAERSRIARAGVEARRRLAAGAVPANPEYEAMWRHALALVPYTTREVEIALTIDWDGNGVLTRRYTGYRPQRGRTVTEISCREATTRRATGSTVAPSVEFELPTGVVEPELHSVIVGSYRVHRIVFPGGWTAINGGELSLRLRTSIPGAYRPPDIGTSADERVDLGDAEGVQLFRVTHPILTLRLGMTFPIGFEPEEWLEPWAWWGETHEPRTPENFLGPAVCRSHHFTGSGRSARLEVAAPLPGHVFALRWRSGSAERFRDLRVKKGRHA